MKLEVILPPTLTVHFNDFIQAGEDGGQLDGGQELFSLQRLGEDHLEDTQHPHVSVLGGEQLWEGTENRTGFKAQLPAPPSHGALPRVLPYH